MAPFVIRPHGRLHEWVAEERGYFRDEGLDYVFEVGLPESWSASSVREVPPQRRRGAFESFVEGRSCDVSSACHWAVNHAQSQGHGRMYDKAYSVTPAGIYVAQDSPVHRPGDLAGVPVAVGYHSGSHFAAQQVLEAFLRPEEIELNFIGLPLDRLTALLEGTAPAALIWGPGQYLLEQNGFRRIADASFMIGFFFSDDVDPEDVERYFRALRRAQMDIDLEPQRYAHHHLRQLPERLHGMADERAFGPGERLVFLPYTRETFDRTQEWIRARSFFPVEEVS
ncbi:hypothetical protein [Spongiactinospora sp. TRM90649]|uniref:ABC transporter substrate-binding protein n=1 Tax=Spongiactinospora sp. TRM90649 TaxID=3031114 RepID=UPI0023F7DCB5|nr:hypothetical protein [Spongiactinospora sp. TRM90649]MDF5756923.1 hypothetical protein [Spongiactinospora sp. TRM90649]